MKCSTCGDYSDTDQCQNCAYQYYDYGGEEFMDYDPREDAIAQLTHSYAEGETPKEEVASELSSWGVDNLDIIELLEDHKPGEADKN